MHGSTQQIHLPTRRKRATFFFKLLKKVGNFEWTEEAEEAFQKLKEYLASSPKGKEDMMLYITATKNVVSTAIVVEREEPRHAYKMQRPVYYISEVLTESKVRYPHVQKLLLCSVDIIKKAETLFP